MIDKRLFPKEYAAIEQLKERSLKIEQAIDIRRKEKQERIEKCRRKLYEKHSVRRHS